MAWRQRPPLTGETLVKGMDGNLRVSQHIPKHYRQNFVFGSWLRNKNYIQDSD